jgi:hypothetical protein
MDLTKALPVGADSFLGLFWKIRFGEIPHKESDNGFATD